MFRTMVRNNFTAFFDLHLSPRACALTITISCWGFAMVTLKKHFNDLETWPKQPVEVKAKTFAANKAQKTKSAPPQEVKDEEKEEADDSDEDGENRKDTNATKKRARYSRAALKDRLDLGKGPVDLVIRLATDGLKRFLYPIDKKKIDNEAMIKGIVEEVRATKLKVEETCGLLTGISEEVGIFLDFVEGMALK